MGTAAANFETALRGDGRVAFGSAGPQSFPGASTESLKANLKLGLRSHGPLEQSQENVEEIAGSATERRMRPIREALAGSDVFGALADEGLDGLVRHGRNARYGSGAAVFRKGDPAEELMVLLRGRIKLSSASRHGREVLFDFIGPGRCFGEMALLEGKTRRLDATAVKPSAVFTLGRRHVLACLEAHPEIAIRIIRVLCERLTRAMEMLEDRTQHGLSSRSARTLLRLASEYGDGLRIDLRISQSEIAGLVGATREKVNRQLCAWCRSGILGLDEGHLTILDHSALRAIAEED